MACLPRFTAFQNTFAQRSCTSPRTLTSVLPVPRSLFKDVTRERAIHAHHAVQYSITWHHRTVSE